MSLTNMASLTKFKDIVQRKYEKVESNLKCSLLNECIKSAINLNTNIIQFLKKTHLLVVGLVTFAKLWDINQHDEHIAVESDSKQEHAIVHGAAKSAYVFLFSSFDWTFLVPPSLNQLIEECSLLKNHIWVLVD